MARGSLLNNKIVLLATICMMLPLAVARAQTSPDPNISLDSRVYSSDLVIEGRLVEPIKDPAVKDAAVRVTAIYRGAAKVGEKILVVGIGDYQKPSPGAGANVPVGPKDALILFLTRAGVGVKHVAFEGEAYVPNPEPWEDFGAGIRMVLRGDVCDFYERPSFSTRWGGPYPPYVMARNMIWPGPPTTVPEDAVLKYRQRLRESADRAFRWHARLDRPATATDIPWLISLIKERYKPLPPPSGGIDWKVNWYREAVAASAVGRLVELRDFRASIQAIAANPIYVNDFSRVFASPQGRDFLLERLADHSLGIPLRKSIGYLVEAAGLDYSANLPRSPATQPSEEHLALRNGSYLTRIAQIAADASSVGDNEIAIALLRMFAWQFSSSRDVPRGTQLALDLHGAASILRQVCANKKASGEIRFRAAETIYAFGEKEFAAVDLQCGPVLALVSPANEIAASTNAITFS
ncbi:MAG TPA: hypothetical protein VFE47_29645, partial [Tepidisphaeraceae bacterium]|nr:hypothetical protein [Tepidisphaeraceae bacterium]